MSETTVDMRDSRSVDLGAVPGLRLVPASWLRLGLRVLLAFVIAVVAVATPILIYAGTLKLTGNIDTVVEGEAYRSAQLSWPALQRLILDRKIRTIINLRGANVGKGWYEDEVGVAQAMQIRHVNVPMSAVREPDAATLKLLIDTLRDAPRPLLIHCESGSDRTGLAAALYQLLVAGEAPDVAMRQMSFYWGHFPWLGSPTIAMDRTLDKVIGGLPPERPN